MLQLILLFVVLPLLAGGALGFLTHLLPATARRIFDRVCFWLLPVVIVIVAAMTHLSWLRYLWVVLYGVGLIALIVTRKMLDHSKNDARVINSQGPGGGRS